MNFDWLKPDYWVSVDHAEGWAIMLGGALTALGTLLAVIFAAILTYRYTVKHSKVTHNTNIQVDSLKRKIDSLEHLWGLLGYMSFSESGTAIIRWREEKKGDKEYFVHMGNLRQFVLNEVSDAFYKQHAGLYLPDNIRDQLFEYQGSLMGLYLRYENESDDALKKIEKTYLVDKFRNAYHQLNKDLKTELKNCYEQLLV